MKKETNEIINGFLSEYPKLIALKESIVLVVEKLKKMYYDGKSVYVCGSGGSCSDSEHIVGELVKAFMLKRKVSSEFEQKLLKMFPDSEELLSRTQEGVRAHSLTSQNGVMTAIVNDLGGEYIFSQQANAYIAEGDILIGISTSGNSKTIINALKISKAKGGFNIGMTGKTGGAIKEYCDILLNVDEVETYRVQQLHLPLYHIICACLEFELFN